MFFTSPFVCLFALTTPTSYAATGLGKPPSRFYREKKLFGRLCIGSDTGLQKTLVPQPS
jgi:hypothetical protein